MMRTNQSVPFAQSEMLRDLECEIQFYVAKDLRRVCPENQSRYEEPNRLRERRPVRAEQRNNDGNTETAQ